MKFYKKIISLILVITIISTTCVGFSSCSKNANTPGKMTVSEYLIALVDEFGMDYTSDEITEESAIETAKEWNIIDSNIISSKTVTCGFVLVTLVKTVGFYDVSSLDDYEIADYAVEKHYNAFKYKGKNDFNKCPNVNEIMESIQNAKDIWANPEFEYTSNIEYKSNVVDLSNEKVDFSKTSDLKIDRDNTSLNNGATDSVLDKGKIFKRDVVVIDGDVDIKDGQTYVSPTMGVSGTYEMYVAENVEHKDGYTYITNSDEEVDIEEILKEASGSDSGTVTDLTSMPITDGDGNIHYPTTSTNTSVYEDAVVTPMYYNPNSSVQATPMKASPSTEFTVKFGDELSASVSIKKSSFKCKITGTINEKKSVDKNKKASVEVNKSLEIKNIGYAYDYDISKKSAYLSVTATQVETTGISLKGEASKSKKIKETKISGDTNGAGAVISKTIAKVPIYSQGVVSICLLVKAKLSINGSVELTVTTQSTYGAELKNGNIRLIKNVKRDKDITVNAKVEVTAYVGPAIYVIGKNVFSFGFEGGLGAAYKMTIHVVNSENNEELYYQDLDINIDKNYSVDAGLKCDVCHDINVYWILKFKVDDECLLISLLQKLGVSKVSAEVEIFGKDNASFIKKHVEDGNDVGKCTRKYIGKEGITEEDVQSFSDKIELENFSLTTYVGDKVSITVKSVPNGYKSSELLYESSDTSIATVSKSGVVTGKDSGSVKINIYTKDKKYNTTIAVMVMEKMSFETDNKVEVMEI